MSALHELLSTQTSTAVILKSLFLVLTSQYSMVGPRNQQASPNHLRHPEAAGSRD